MIEIVQILPSRIREKIESLSTQDIQFMEEIRIRIQRPLEVIIKGKPTYLNYIVTNEDGIHLLNQLSQHSIYTIEEELRRGYITIRGGHRVGLAGKVITEKGKVKVIRDVTSFNIRMARQKVGIANPLVSVLYKHHWLNTMIIGPPQTGKTTLLRDLARLISEGNQTISSSKVGIVDERSEIAGCVKGIPQHTFGTRVDVLDACPKAEGMMMMIRSMSPDVLIVDEIGRHEDSGAVMEAIHAGVRLMTTVHGFSFEDIKKRPILRELINLGVFERYIELSGKSGPGTILGIRDQTGVLINQKAGVS